MPLLHCSETDVCPQIDGLHESQINDHGGHLLLYSVAAQIHAHDAITILMPTESATVLRWRLPPEPRKWSWRVDSIELEVPYFCET